MKRCSFGYDLGNATPYPMNSSLPQAGVVRPLLLALFLAFTSLAALSATSHLIPAGNALRATAYSSSGRFGEIALETPSGGFRPVLLYRERTPGRPPTSWEVVNEDPSRTAASLTFDANDQPRIVFTISNSEILEFVREKGVWVQHGKWPLLGRVGGVDVEGDDRQGVIAFDSSGTPHVMLLAATFWGENPSLIYARLESSANGADAASESSPSIRQLSAGRTFSAQWELAHPPSIKTTELSGFDYPGFLNLDYMTHPRHMDMVVDGAGTTHVVFSVDQIESPVPGGTRQSSVLFYLSRASNGAWSERQVVQEGEHVDAGIAASLAVSPSGLVAIAATWLPRASTGSPGVAELRYLTRTRAGWASTTVANQSDNYRSNDGERGTGMDPQLRFDEESRPHIVFTDHASGHFPGSGASSFSGQVRYATRESSTAPWTVATLVNSGGVDPMDFQIFRPSLALAYGQAAVTAVAWRWSEAASEYEHEL